MLAAVEVEPEAKVETPEEPEVRDLDLLEVSTRGTTVPLKAQQDDPSNTKARSVRRRDPWRRALQQREAVMALASERSRLNREARTLLVGEIHRQIPLLRVSTIAEEIGAKHLVNLVVDGGGPLGIKTLNDQLIGFALNADWLVPRQQLLFKQIFESLPLEEGEVVRVAEQTYKQTTLVTNIEDSQRLSALMAEGLDTFDQAMLGLLVRALGRGRAFWRREIQQAVPGGPREREARARVDNITALLEALPGDAAGWRYPVNFGSAELNGSTPREVLKTNLRSLKAARITKTLADPAITRGGAYHEEEFLSVVKKARLLRRQIVDAGNALYWKGLEHPIFATEGEELIPNRTLLREIRKGRVDPDDLEDEDREMLALTMRYLAHVNTLDYFKNFSSEDLDRALPERVAAGRSIIQSLVGGRPVAEEALWSILSQGVTGESLAELGTASEARFYHQLITHERRLFIQIDIIDLGVELTRSLAAALHRLSGDDVTAEDLWRISLSATDSVVGIRRAAFRDTREIVQDYRRQLLETLAERKEKSKKFREAYAELKAEKDPLLLLGGDEITIALHPLFERVLPELAADLSRALNARVGVSRSRATGGGHFARRAAHKNGIAQADAGTATVKWAESHHRRFIMSIARIEDEKARADLTEMLEGLHLLELFADTHEKQGSRLRRIGTGEWALDIEEQVQALRDAAALQLKRQREA